MLRLPKLKLWQWLAIGLVVANLTVVYVAFTRPDGLAHIYFLDVGQGDSIFIKTAENHKILIDGGSSANVVNLLDRLMPAWSRAIDLVILTHPHADHAAGLIEVLKRYSAREFLFNGMVYESETYTTLLQIIDERHLNIVAADTDCDYTFNQAQLDVIYPSVDDQPFDDPNDSSIVSNFKYGNFELLLTGDISTKVERELIQGGLLPDIDILKIAHQGSRTSTSQSLIDVTQPEVGIISVGRNKFGHPHMEVIDRLQQSNVHLYRTDENGTIEVVTDGERYQILTRL